MLRAHTVSEIEPVLQNESGKSDNLKSYSTKKSLASKVR